MKRLIITAWLLTASVLFGAVPQEKGKGQGPSAAVREKSIEFAGYSILAKDRLFVLYDTDAKESSLWLKLGQTWRGYTVLSFDPKTERLTLSKEKTDLILSLRSSKVGKAIFLPGLVEGTYTLLDGTVVYSPDAKLKLGTGVSISSPTGLMVSDHEQKIVGGDLAVETGDVSVQAREAIVDVSKGVITAKSMTVTSKSASKPKTPNKAPEPTPGSVTPRAIKSKSK